VLTARGEEIYGTERRRVSPELVVETLSALPERDATGPSPEEECGGIASALSASTDAASVRSH